MMPKPTSPSDIAREVLRIFAARRIPPTPSNFRQLYSEVSGQKDDPNIYFSPVAKKMAQRLPRDTAEKKHLLTELEKALAADDMLSAQTLLFSYIDILRPDTKLKWNTLIGSLLKYWEWHQSGWTTAKKRDALDRVLASTDTETLFTRLQHLVDAWANAPQDTPVIHPAVSQTASPDTATDHADRRSATPVQFKVLDNTEAQQLIDTLRSILLGVLDNVVPALLGSLPEQPDLFSETLQFAEQITSSDSIGELEKIAVQLRQFAYKLELKIGDHTEVETGIINLFTLLIENIEEIVVDSQWLHGQVDILRELLLNAPGPRQISDAEARLKELIYKQSQVKYNLSEAQLTLKTMLSTFVDQLAQFAEQTGSYHDRISEKAQKICSVQHIEEITPLLNEVIQDTKDIQATALNSHNELQNARQRVTEAETQIQQLRRELEEASRLIRHDQLTGSLNRRGLEEIFARECARAERRQTPLCLALLDVDNFKALNDTFGHQAGDEALIYLVRNIRQHLRPEDFVARTGGEEFVLLMPEIRLQEACALLVCLQRELTKTCFLTNEQRILVTFSAGASLWKHGEILTTLMNRADKAMYTAKQQGKNKVVPSADDSPVKEPAIDHSDTTKQNL